MNPRIVLTMIVKNEEHVIERALNSCYKMIDSYCIVDTGSTDKTKEVIKNFFDSKGIEGKIVDFEFTNFEECRNKSIEEGKELGEYGFWMDADEQVILDKKFNKTIFKQILKNENPGQLLIECRYGAMVYSRAQFYKFKTGFYWYGPVHEVLKTDNKDNRIIQFQFGHMFITPDGNSWQTDDLSKKYEEHAEILLKYQEDNDWKDPRWTFYLAQSYRDAANIRLEKDAKDEHGLKLCRKAIQYYDERANTREGFYQEIYYSQLALSKLSYHINTDEFVVNHLMKCEEINIDGRVEHFFNICSFLQSSGLHKNALMYLKQAMKYLKEGTKASLFIEQWIYDYAIYEMYAASLYHTGQLEDALKYFKYTLKKVIDGNYGDSHIQRVENNIKSVENAIRQQNLNAKKGRIRI